LFDKAEKLKNVVIFESFEKYLENAVKMSMNKNITVYDALYIAQAKEVGKLLTCDNVQSKIAKELGIDVTVIE